MPLADEAVESLGRDDAAHARGVLVLHLVGVRLVVGVADEPGVFERLHHLAELPDALGAERKDLVADADVVTLRLLGRDRGGPRQERQQGADEQECQVATEHGVLP